MARRLGQRVFGAGAALAGPILVFALVGWGLSSYTDEDDAMAARNAGRVLNAKVLQGSSRDVMDRVLAVRRPRAVVVGPSYANTNVRPTQLATALGMSPDDLVLLSVPNSVGAHWYAILRYRLFEAGYRPDLVVVVSGLQSMLLTTPLTESSYVNLAVQLPEGADPVIDRKVGGSSALWWARLREQRGKVRTQLFAGIHRSVWWWRPERTRVALGRVFDDARIDMSLHERAMPIVESRQAERAYTPDLLPEPEDSFLGDISSMVAAHGADLVWVRPPMSPHIPDHLDDVVLPGVQERARGIVEAEGATFVDMRSLPMTSAMFRNEDHMNEDGSRRFTDALAKALGGRRVAIRSTTPSPPLPVTIDVSPALAPPEALAVLPGVGRWIPPGATVRVIASEAWGADRGPFGIHASVEALAPVATPTIRHAGLSLPLGEVWAPAGWKRWVGVLTTSAPLGPFEVTLTTDPRGGWIRWSSLALGPLDTTDPHPPIYAVGSALGRTGDRIGLLAEAGRFPTYPKAPVRVPGHDRPISDLDGVLAAFETDRWAFLSDEATMGATTWGRPCSPLRITEDGVALSGANVPCTEVRREGEGRSCHASDRIFFSASDTTDPASNGRTYRLILDPSRQCDGQAWIYPVDQLRLPIPAADRMALDEGASFLTLDARYLNFREAHLDVRLVVDGQLRIDDTIDGRDLKHQSRTWPVVPPLTASDVDVTLEIDNRAHTFYLVRDVVLSERPPEVR